ncbi:hypothetical protein D3C85_1346920 [compost metagenome]
MHGTRIVRGQFVDDGTQGFVRLAGRADVIAARDIGQHRRCFLPGGILTGSHALAHLGDGLGDGLQGQAGRGLDGGCSGRGRDLGWRAPGTGCALGGGGALHAACALLRRNANVLFGGLRCFVRHWSYPCFALSPGSRRPASRRRPVRQKANRNSHRGRRN